MSVQKLVVVAAALLPTLALAAEKGGGTDLGAVTGGNLPEQGFVVPERCIGCHTPERIEAARKHQKNMAAILKLMENKGVTLTDRDRRVLQHFWEAKPFK